MAEYGWGLSSELKNKASVELNENPEYTAEAIDVVREQIDTRPDISMYIILFHPKYLKWT
jgi:hypothetical protein